MAARSCFFAGVLAATCILHAAPAHADVTSFFSTGGGYGAQRNDTTKKFEGGGGMSFALGVGTDPLRKVVLAGMLRTTTFFGIGTDLGLAARVATGSFARGQWGLAFDLGPAWRSFGRGEYGRWPITAMITGGAPWGVQLGVGAEVLKLGGNDAQALGFVALLEIDLLRLTVMRQGSTDTWWPNPAPAGGRIIEQQARNGPLSRPHPDMGPLPGLLW